MSRRKFIRLLVGGLAGSLLTGSTGALYTLRVEPRWLAVERVTVPIPNLSPALSSLTIAQMSDLHYGPHVSAAEIRRAVNAILKFQPHLIVLTGDYVTGSGHLRDGCLVQELARLTAPLGVYAILGNHDYWSGETALFSAQLESAGITLFRNGSLPIRVGDADLWVVGVDDVWEQHNDLPRALANVPSTAPKLLLVHEPDFADTVAAHDVTLQLSGHSHGGQVRLPIIGAPVLPWLGTKYPQGLRRVGEMWLYTNRGVGMISPPLRFNCRPEVTLLTIKRKA